MPLWKDHTNLNLSEDDIDTALPYTKKALLVLILAGGATNRYGTPTLGEMGSIFEAAELENKTEFATWTFSELIRLDLFNIMKKKLGIQNIDT